METVDEVKFKENLEKFKELYKEALEKIYIHENPYKYAKKDKIPDIDYLRYKNLRKEAERLLGDIPQAELQEFADKVILELKGRIRIEEAEARKKYRAKVITGYFSGLLKSIGVDLDTIETREDLWDIVPILEDGSFVLCEKAKSYIRELYGIYQGSIKDIEENPDFLNLAPSGNVVKNFIEKTNMLDDYRRDTWGIDRICLDGIQNHLPSDSKGTNCYVQFLVGDKWVGPNEAKAHRSEITKVRFCDDGVGFDYELLVYYHSNKPDIEFAVGHFGEGLKLAANAALNEGLGLEIHSKNYIAKAIGLDRTITNNLKDNQIEHHTELAFDITVYDGEPIKGSRTIFNTPTDEFIDYALRLPELVLPLNKKKPEFVGEDIQIVDSNRGGMAFVNGVYVRDISSIFSYNFINAELNPNRNDFVNQQYSSDIDRLRDELDDIVLLKKIVSSLVEFYKNNHPMRYYSNLPSEFSYVAGLLSKVNGDIEEGDLKRANLWKQAFQEVCEDENIKNSKGEKKEAVLKTDYKIPPYMEDQMNDYTLIRLRKDWQEFFNAVGIKTDEEIVPDYIEKKIKSPITTEYVKEVWNEQRILIDAVQNHLPSDSKGTQVFIRFQTEDGNWHDYRELPYYSNSEIKKIKIADNGIGYDYESLSILASTKDSPKSSGKWGEGLKMFTAAALKQGIKVEFRSQNWLSIPYIEENTVNGKKVHEIYYRTTIKTEKESKANDDGDNPQYSDYGYTKALESSSTTFIDPSSELINQFRTIEDNVLYFSNSKPIYSVSDNHILSQDKGQLFVKSLLVPGNHQIKYSYHLENFDIETRDRNSITPSSMKMEIAKIFENLTDERIISTFLMDAIAFAMDGKQDFLEFRTPLDIESKTPQADAWINTFFKYLGNKAVIRKASSQEENMIAQAQHQGLTVVTLPDHLADSLKDLTTTDGKKIMTIEEALKEKVINRIGVNPLFLTKEEKDVLKKLYEYNDMINQIILSQDPDNPSIIFRNNCLVKKIKVFDYPEGYTGSRSAGLSVVNDPYTDYVEVSRDTLKRGDEYAGHILIHELNHVYTNADDTDRDFRNNLSILSSILIKILSQRGSLAESIDDNGVAKNITTSHIQRFINSLKQRLSSMAQYIINLFKDDDGR